MYITYGKVRGGCGHRHRTAETAERCRASDQRDCRAAGGYSDRAVYEVVNGDRIPVLVEPE